MMGEPLSDRARLSHAREFFWKVMNDWDQIVTPDVAERQIRKLAESLPPFTRIVPPQNKDNRA